MSTGGGLEEEGAEEEEGETRGGYPRCFAAVRDRRRIEEDRSNFYLFATREELIAAAP